MATISVAGLKMIAKLMRHVRCGGSVESSVQDVAVTDHIDNYPMMRKSPGSASFGSCSIGSLAANLSTQFLELEGPRYHYRPLFGIASERMVHTSAVFRLQFLETANSIIDIISVMTSFHLLVIKQTSYQS